MPNTKTDIYPGKNNGTICTCLSDNNVSYEVTLHNEEVDLTLFVTTLMRSNKLNNYEYTKLNALIKKFGGSKYTQGVDSVNID